MKGGKTRKKRKRHFSLKGRKRNDETRNCFSDAKVTRVARGDVAIKRSAAVRPKSCQDSVAGYLQSGVHVERLERLQSQQAYPHIVHEYVD